MLFDLSIGTFGGMGNEPGKAKGIPVPHAEAFPTWIGRQEERCLSIGAAVGENVRTFRAARGITQSEFARMLTTLGERWTKGRVHALENGDRESVTLSELIQLSVVLRKPLHELIAGDGEVQLTERAIVPRGWLARALVRGEVPDWTLDDPTITDPAAAEIAERLTPNPATLTEIREIHETAVRLYGRTATEERAARVGEVDDPESSGTAYRRRNFMQQLVNEIRDALEGE